MKTILALIAGLWLVMGIAPVAEAQASQRTAKLDDTCTARIEFPEDREELSLQDVRHAISVHLQRIGAAQLKADVARKGDGIVVVQLRSPEGVLVRRLEVDASTAEIVANQAYLQPLLAAAGAQGTRATETEYQQRLRRHMLGDGKPWEAWVGTPGKNGGCADDYEFGAPEIK